jgi:hypothetical protein
MGRQRRRRGEKRPDAAAPVEARGASAAPERRRDDPRVTGMLCASEFELARAAMAELDARADYDDWLEFRESEQRALSLAGVAAVSVLVAARPFLRWRPLTGRPPSERSLDAFATTVWALEHGRAVAALASVDANEFAVQARRVPAFVEAGGFERWRERREAQRARAGSAGARVEETPIRVAAFLDWRPCVGLEGTEEALDRYARLPIEELTFEATSDPSDRNA